MTDDGELFSGAQLVAMVRPFLHRLRQRSRHMRIDDRWRRSISMDGPAAAVRLCTVQNPVRLSRATRVATESTLSTIANALPFHEFRAIYVDHRGVGRSDKPHERAAYAMRLRVADAVAVLDALGIQRAHFVGTSYGARLCFGIGEHAPRRVRSLVIGGQQPYRMDRHTALGRLITESLAASRESNTMTPFVDALEAWAGSPLPEDMRALWLDNDPAAIEAASAAMLDEGDVAADLASWSLQCVLFVGADDVDFFEGAQRAAREIPNADFVALAGLGDIGAHLEQDPVLNAVFRTLRADA